MSSTSSEEVENLNSKSSLTPKAKEVQVDVFKDTPLRYLGYANELGESLGPVYPRLVAPSYAVAFAYVGGDTLDKAYRSHQRGRPVVESCQIATDTFIWQLFASGSILAIKILIIISFYNFLHLVFLLKCSFLEK